MPAPDKLPADFDFSKQGPPDKLPANFDFGGGQPNQTPEKPGYWQELWQQSGIPGLVKGIKEHPAETVANAIGGLFAPLNPNYTQSEQGQALKGNLTRSPQSAAAALTLGALAAAPTVAGPIAEGAANAGKYIGAATKAGGGGVIGGLAKAGVGEVLAKVPGMELPARFGLQYPAIRQVAKAIEKGHEAGVAAVNPAKAATGAATAVAPEPTLAGGTTVQDIGKGLGIKNWKTATPEAKATAQETFDRLKAAEQGGSQANPAAPSQAYTPRPPDYYGVKAAEVPPQPAQSAPAPTQPASAAPPSVPPNVQPIRPEPPPVVKENSVAPESSGSQPKPASGATAAKSIRYADAISKWAKDMGMTPKDIADQWGTTTPEVRGQILLELKRKGYLGANETIPNTSAPGIISALKAKAATIKPPAGFSLGSMKSQ